MKMMIKHPTPASLPSSFASIDVVTQPNPNIEIVVGSQAKPVGTLTNMHIAGADTQGSVAAPATQVTGVSQLSTLLGTTISSSSGVTIYLEQFTWDVDCGAILADNQQL